MLGVTSFANPLDQIKWERATADCTPMPRTSERTTTTNSSIIPELTVNMGINLTKAITLFAGYNFMCISQVARPGQPDQPGDR